MLDSWPGVHVLLLALVDQRCCCLRIDQSWVVLWGVPDVFIYQLVFQHTLFIILFRTFQCLSTYIQPTDWWFPQSSSQFIFSTLQTLPSINNISANSSNIFWSFKWAKVPEEVEWRRRRWFEMEVEQQQNKSRIVKIDSPQTWDFYVNQATTQGCPVSEIPSHVLRPFWSKSSFVPLSMKKIRVRDEDSYWVNLFFSFKKKSNHMMPVLLVCDIYITSQSLLFSSCFIIIQELM